MKQIVIIRGGTTFNDYNAYLESLRTKTINLDWITYSLSWRENLQAELGDDYTVLIPSMPNTANARYSEWKLYFEQLLKVLDEDVIFIGHSMGGIFLAKYLSENQVSLRIKATILVAAPFGDESSEDLGDFKLGTLTDTFTTQAGHVILFGSQDDPVIAPADFAAYRAALPTATVFDMSAPDHFMRPHLPELTKAIQAL